MNQLQELFRKFAGKTAHAIGTPIAFFVAVIVVVVWILSGPLFGFSDTWQLLINTGTTIATFLIVFLIQNTQNRDSQAIQLKLDELLRAVRAARDSMVDLEDSSDEELKQVAQEFRDLRESAVHKARQTNTDTREDAVLTKESASD